MRPKTTVHSISNIKLWYSSAPIHRLRNYNKWVELTLQMGLSARTDIELGRDRVYSSQQVLDHQWVQTVLYA
ncbi:CEL_1a_G0014730.mRNA.1.CDS.1 [Saccharomyces cerevisiae]|nr:CEL_1a_G0014730.mRNA.1.CDS.1 [Saccharomyces cerevisiae]CAI7256695.1 CEL_1a_G0014730.mRNA.1.CDS.1 [Saccharomyces cerevisiae]